MQLQRGFSFIEVLIALGLSSATSIVLLKQETYLYHQMNHIISRVHARIEQDNRWEYQCVEALPMQKGMSLLEMLIALFLMGFILMALWQSYFYIKKSYFNLQEQYEEIIDTQLLLDMLRNSIYRAGFSPCSSIDSLKLINHHRKESDTQSVVLGDESIRFHSMSMQFNTVQSTVAPSQVIVHGTLRLAPGEAVLLADCQQGEILTLESIVPIQEETRVFFKQAMHYHYQEPIYLGAWEEESYFMKVHHKIRGLFYQHKHREELTRAIVGFTVVRELLHGHIFLHLRMLLKNGKTTLLDSVLRNS